jgi:hypothetical protein
MLEPNFLADHQSVTSVISQLHNYFKNSYSHYKIQQGNLVSQLESADRETETQLRQDIDEIQEELVIYGILSDALSIADRMLHTRSVRKELGDDNGVYKMHDSDQATKSTL